MELKKQYEAVVNKYMELFCKKQEVDFEYWVGDDVGGVVEIADAFFDFNDIRYDIDTNQPENLIFEWYWELIESKIKINYSSYSKGLRLKDLKE